MQTNRSFGQPREAVYAAWINPEIVRHWLFVSPTNRLTGVNIEPQPGGVFSIDELNNDEMIEHWGHFTQVDPPRRLAFTLNVPKHFHGEALITVEIEKTAEGCRLTLTQPPPLLRKPSRYGKPCSTALQRSC